MIKKLENNNGRINTNNSIRHIKKNKNSIKHIKIEVKKFIDKLCRRVNVSLYYNKECYTLLKPEELQSLPKLLFYLYHKKTTYKNTGRRIGIQTSVIYKECDLSIPTINQWLARLIPVVINMSFYKPKSGGHISRYYSLNENGILLCKKLMEINKNGIEI